MCVCAWCAENGPYGKLLKEIYQSLLKKILFRIPLLMYLLCLSHFCQITNKTFSLLFFLGGGNQLRVDCLK